jgi:transcriptional regulator with XRE-family HTH domain
MISSTQIKAARLFLGWEQKDLAAATGLSLPTIQRMEKLGLERSSAGNAEKVQTVMEAAGVVFIPAGSYQGEGGPGVRLKGGEKE